MESARLLMPVNGNEMEFMAKLINLKKLIFPAVEIAFCSLFDVLTKSRGNDLLEIASDLNIKMPGTD